MAATIPLFTIFFLLSNFPFSLPDHLPSRIQRAEHIIFPIHNISAAKDVSEIIRVEENEQGPKEVSKVHSQALTTAECANFRAESENNVTVYFNSAIFSSILRRSSVTQLIEDGPNPVTTYSILDSTGVLASGGFNFVGFCPESSSDFNLFYFSPSSPTSDGNVVINFFIVPGLQCTFSPGKTLRVFWSNAVRSTGQMIFSDLRDSASDSLNSKISAINLNEALTGDYAFTSPLGLSLYTYVTFRSDSGPTICYFCTILANRNDARGGMWIVFFGTSATPRVEIKKRISVSMVSLICSFTSTCLDIPTNSPTQSPENSPSLTPLTSWPLIMPTPFLGPTSFPTPSNFKPSTYPTPSPTAFPADITTTLPDCDTKFFDVFGEGMDIHRVKCRRVQECASRVWGCPLDNGFINERSSICTAAKMLGIVEFQTFKVQYVPYIPPGDACTANGITSLPSDEPSEGGIGLRVDNSSPENKDEVSTTAIVGSVVGGVVFIGGVLAVLYYRSKRRFSHRTAKLQTQTARANQKQFEVMGIGDSVPINLKTSMTAFSPNTNAVSLPTNPNISMKAFSPNANKEEGLNTSGLASVIPKEIIPPIPVYAAPPVPGGEIAAEDCKKRTEEENVPEVSGVVDKEPIEEPYDQMTRRDSL